MKNLPHQLFVSGIDTGVGKTLISAILCEALEADYWKPVQAGDLQATDSMRVRSLLTNKKSVVHPEAYLLQTPASPLLAANIDGVVVTDEKLHIPETKNRLVIEGAGGLMVHLRPNFLFLDFLQQKKLPAVLVSKNYLGSINHTLLSVEVLKQRGIEILGIVFSGNSVPDMEAVIENYTQLPILARVPQVEKVTATFVQEQAMILLNNIKF